MTGAKKYITTFILLVFLLLCTRLEAADTDHFFPEFDCIKDNVSFWMKVYSEYPSTKGLVHDKDDLRLIYGLIDLLPEDAPGSHRVNRARTTAAKDKYSAILQRLANGASAMTDEEKKIVALFGPNPSKTRLLIASTNLRLQRCQRDRFREGLIRSGRYVEEIQIIFRDRGLPVDLAYLPHVESSFNYEAYSKFGAAGIWQFTRSTGKRFLSVDYVLDERRDPLRASEAAARYLKENYDLLGNWPMAITAYNHGEAGVQRAKEQLGTYERIFREYEKGYFKFASRNFYSEFLAARKIARNYRRYFGNIDLEKPRPVLTIPLPGFLSLDQALNHFAVDEQTIRSLNPALRLPVFSGQKYIPKGYGLRLPTVTTGARIAEAMPLEIFHETQKRSKFYTVQRGDTAGLIARRHRVRLQDLVLANNLDRRATVYIGQTLRIPGVGEKTAKTVLIRPAKKKASEHIENVVHVADVPDAADDDAATKSQPKEENTIPEEPAPRTLAPGQAVATNFEFSDSEAVHLTVQKTFTRDNSLFGIIRVAPEETVGHFAEWLNVSTRDILAPNNRRNSLSIHTDQELVIPLTKVTAKEFEMRRFEYHREIEEDFFAAFQVENVVPYKVQKGDSIWSICYEKLELPVWLLKKYNTHIDFNSLHPSQTLNVPQVSLTSQS